MTLSIRPVRLKRSVYFRVPNDIVDLIDLEDDAKVSLTLEETDDCHLLVYSVLKMRAPHENSEIAAYSIREAIEQPKNRILPVRRV